MLSRVKIRESIEEDKDEVYALILSIMESEFENIPSHVYLKDIADIPHAYGGEGNIFYVCEDENRVVGTIALKREDQEEVLLRRFFVNPHYRGKGIGLELVKKAISFCKQHRYKRIYFTSNKQMEKAKTLLKSMGFKEDASIPANLGIFKLLYEL